MAGSNAGLGGQADLAREDPSLEAGESDHHQSQSSRPSQPLQSQRQEAAPQARLEADSTDHDANHRGLAAPEDSSIENVANIDGLAAPAPAEAFTDDEGNAVRSSANPRKRGQGSGTGSAGRDEYKEDGNHRQPTIAGISATQLYTISHLIFFSFLGTLARLGLQAATFYPGAPIIFGELWANFGGCVLMGFFIEDRKLFQAEWGAPTTHQKLENGNIRAQEIGGENAGTAQVEAAKKAHVAVKKTIPLYVGLTTGFCGCFTSFSSFIRDAFLALSNTLPTSQTIPGVNETTPRNGGYSVNAVLAVIIATVAISLSGLIFGIHLGAAMESLTPSIPLRFRHKVLDRVTVFLAFGCWIGAVFLAIFPPDRHRNGDEIWRGRAVFALVFAPLGCLGRYYLSLWLNSKISSFPLGTFTANIAGTIILGIFWDLQHVPLGGTIGCQAFQGIEDGFCGCLTTVSTWVTELASLRRRHAYIYGAASVSIALCFLVVIMGSMKWTIGFGELLCKH